MIDSEVPRGLQREIAALDVGKGDGEYTDTVGFIETFLGPLPEECPECGVTLSATRVYMDAARNAKAVRLACERTHVGGRSATYIYHIPGNELYFEREIRPESPSDGDD